MKKKPTDADKDRMVADLVARRDADIDTIDIPEIPTEKWELARRENFYRPIKQPVTIRLDADVVAWFKNQTGASGYQTEINRVLRQHMIGKLEK